MRSTAGTATAAQHLGQAATRIAASLALLALIAYLLGDRIRALDLPLAFATITTFHPGQWAAALAATALSFWAVGRYDATLHRHLATSVAAPEARRAGIAAIAISQTIGAGVFTGALVRWRMLRGVSLWQATRISLAVTLSFLGGWAFFTGAVLTFTPASPLPLFGPAALAAGFTLFAAGLWQPHALRRLHLPNASTQTRLILLTALDTCAACAALYTLLPPGTLPPATLLPAFLLALGAGLASGTPGGVGPFEVTLLALLPQVPEAPLLAAIFGWRIVYFAIPAVLGAALAARGPAPRARGADPALRPMPPTHLAQAPRAESALLHQGHLSLMQSRLGGLWITGRTAHTLIGMFDPVGSHQPPRATRHALAHQARAEARSAAIYKCSPSTAALARQLGWQITPLGREAVITPATFTLQGPATANLR
ncbi:MAG: phosphatidylglycerol lysyltransferase domain-containing protein, partial [Paracoccaceae bacterium]